MNKNCYKDCKNCGKASYRTDDKGYPFGIECLKYNDSLPLEHSNKPKSFTISDKRSDDEEAYREFCKKMAHKIQLKDGTMDNVDKIVENLKEVI